MQHEYAGRRYSQYPDQNFWVNGKPKRKATLSPGLLSTYQIIQKTDNQLLYRMRIAVNHPKLYLSVEVWAFRHSRSAGGIFDGSLKVTGSFSLHLTAGRDKLLTSLMKVIPTICLVTTSVCSPWLAASAAGLIQLFRFISYLIPPFYLLQGCI